MRTAKRAPVERPKVFLDLTGGGSRLGEAESQESSGSELEDEFEEWRNQRAVLKGAGARRGGRGGQSAGARQALRISEDPAGPAGVQREGGGEEEHCDGRSGEEDRREGGRAVMEVEAAAREVEEVPPVKTKEDARQERLLGGIGGSRPGSPFLPSGAMGPHELREFLEGSQHLQNGDSSTESSEDEAGSGDEAGVAAYGR